MTATQAPTPGPLSVESAGPYSCMRCDNSTWNDDDICDQCAAEACAPENAIDWPDAPTAPVEASGSERDIKGETFMGFRVAAWRYRQGDETHKLPHHYAEHWSTPSASAWGIQRLFTEDQLQQALSLHPQPSGETREVVLKGVGKVNGDGWKDTTTEGEIVFVWNVEKPTPYAPGQYPRVGNEGWSASTSQYNFTPATADDVPSILALLSARPLALGGQHSTATDFPPDDVLACVNDTTPARAEAQDEGAAGYLVALLASYCGDDTSGCTGETPCLDCVRMANVYKIPKTALGEFVGELGNIAASSPTPAADADRVRIAVEALEKADAAARSGAAMSAADYSISAERLGEEIYKITTPALAALKSTAAKEGGEG